MLCAQMTIASSEPKTKFPAVRIVVPIVVTGIAVWIVQAMEPINVHGGAGMALLGIGFVLVPFFCLEIISVWEAAALLVGAPEHRNRLHFSLVLAGMAYIVTCAWYVLHSL